MNTTVRLVSTQATANLQGHVSATQALVEPTALGKRVRLSETAPNRYEYMACEVFGRKPKASTSVSLRLIAYAMCDEDLKGSKQTTLTSDHPCFIHWLCILFFGTSIYWLRPPSVCTSQPHR